MSRIRAARPADATAVEALSRAALPDANAALELAGELARPDTVAIVAVGAPGETVVGHALGRRAADRFEIHEIAVAPDRRRRGLGRALLVRLLSEAAAAGARSAGLEVRAGDAGARAFYAERRFREIGRRPRYYRNGEDAILMSRAIGALRTDATVVANQRDGETGRRLRLRVPGWPGSEPGQFVMLSPGARGAVPRTDPLLPRPMAIYRTLGDGNDFEVLYKVVGRGTALLAEATAGDPIGVVGPLGRGFAPPGRDEHAVLIGGGTGTASLLDQAALAARTGRATVLLGARTAGDLIGLAEFRALDVDLQLATEDGSEGHAGLVTELLASSISGDGRSVVYACGPTPMMRAAADLAGAHGVPCRVSLENPMACGFGVCLGCAAPLAAGGFALVCRDGPVLDADQVAWEQLS